MKTLRLTFIRRFYSLALAGAVIISTSAMCEGSAVSADPDPTPEIPEPKSDSAEVQSPRITLENIPQVYFNDEKSMTLAFRVESEGEIPAVELLSSEGCRAEMSDLKYLGDEVTYSGSVSVDIDDDADSYTFTLRAVNSAGRDQASATLEKAALRGYDKELSDGDYTKHRRTVVVGANFDGDCSCRVIRMDDPVNRYLSYIDKWIFDEGTGYDQGLEWLQCEVSDASRGIITLKFDSNDAFYWIPLPDRKAEVEVCRISDSGKSIKDTISVVQKGDDGTQFQYEQQLVAEIFGFDSWKEALANGCGAPASPSTKGYVTEWRAWNEQKRVWDKNGFALDERIGYFSHLDVIEILGGYNSMSLKWPLPESFKKLKLQGLNLTGCNINGKLDDDVLKAIAENLQQDIIFILTDERYAPAIRLFNNNLTGRIPEWIFCRDYPGTAIFINGNRLEGEIPSWSKECLGYSDDDFYNSIISQQEGYKVWIEGEEPEDYQFHESYYE